MLVIVFVPMPVHVSPQLTGWPDLVFLANWQFKHLIIAWSVPLDGDEFFRQSGICAC